MELHRYLYQLPKWQGQRYIAPHYQQNERLAAHFGVNERTIARWIKTLEQVGAIRCEMLEGINRRLYLEMTPQQLEKILDGV